MTYWARTVAAGRLHQPEEAKADLAKYDSLIEEIKKGKRAYHGRRHRRRRSNAARWWLGPTTPRASRTTR